MTAVREQEENAYKEPVRSACHIQGLANLP